MNLIGYCRVSTDDKGQNPQRQKDVIQAWASRSGHAVHSYAVDEGTSGATDPFQRQHMREAINEAKEQGCDGIVVESVDRATRGGVEALMLFKAQLRIDYGLRLVMASNPPELPPAIEEFWDSAMAMVARMFRERLREQTKSGIARARANGWPNGQPGRRPKPKLTLAEKELVKELVIIKEMGVDRVALEISRVRGAFNLADPRAQARTRVGPTWIHEQVRTEMPQVAERWSARKNRPKPTKKPDSERGA